MAPQPRVLFAALAAALLVLTPAATARDAAPPVPVQIGPASGTTVASLPAFAWGAVDGAAKYEFELAGDPGFNAPIARLFTRNTRATLDKTVANATYWWRVRSVDAGGAVSAWSAAWSIVKNWASAPTLSAPADGASVVYPSTPLTLRWNAAPGAAKYRLHVATDPLLGSTVASRYPLDTQAVAFTPPELLAPGTYYWAVTPIDAQGNLGSRSPVWSFTWVWPTTMTGLSVTDLVAADEVFDPQLSWPAVPGAAGYEVEINFAPAPDWPVGSKVCCKALSFSTSATTLGTKFSPEVVLDNTKEYRWRVRAIDAAGNAGVWNEGAPFTKPFDNVPYVTAPSVKNVHMRDNLGDPATDTDGVTPVLDTAVPVVVWNSVPGASGYEVNMTAYNGVGCDWATAAWLKETATPAWTPLGWGKVSGDGPWPTGGSPSTDAQALTAGATYCVRVRAVDRPSTTGGPTVYGDWTYLNGNNQPAFRWNGPPASSSCTSPCQMTSAEYVTPITGDSVARMPLFTWKPVPGAESYYVVVAQDANFTNVVDYAYTRIPAYAPRKGTASLGYPDDANVHWAVLPADNANGSGVYADLLASGAQVFAKQSQPPTLVEPVADAAVNTPATVFRWSPVAEGVRRYRIQVSQDPTFATTLDDAVTDSTAYTSNKTFPSDTTLYWRVRVDAESGFSTIGLPWSLSGTFTKQLPRPTWDPGNPTSGDLIPTLRWDPVPGAVSYDFHIQLPDGSRVRDATNIHANAITAIEMTGTGIFQWQVRANFPSATFGTVDGPYNDLVSFTRTIREPSAPREDVGQSRLLLAWDAKTGAKRYKVQISARPDFAPALETVTTDHPTFASTLASLAYAPGGTFYWHVAAVDADGNVGAYTATRSFVFPALPATATSPPPTTTPPPPAPTLKHFRLAAKGYPVYRRYRTIRVYVKNATLRPVYRARVRVSGAGLTARTKYTGRLGVAKFSIRPTRYGRVTFKVSKRGFQTKYLYRKVRRPS